MYVTEMRIRLDERIGSTHFSLSLPRRLTIWLNSDKRTLVLGSVDTDLWDFRL